ncbi:MAG: hypothetical protein ABIQ72_06795 [Usitatibacter sp.]
MSLTFKGSLAALAIAVAATGCAPVNYERPEQGPTPGAAAMPSKGQRAGVISVLGERPANVHMGATDTTPGSHEVEAAQRWQVDFFAETVVERWAVSRGFTTVVAGDRRSEFAGLAKFHGATAAEFLDLGTARAAVDEFARRERLDQVLIVTPAHVPEQYSGPMDVHAGYGLWNRGTLSGCFSVVRISVYDVKAGKVTKQQQGTRMSRRENSALAGRSLTNLSETLQSEMRDCMMDAIDFASDYALDRLGL